MNIVIDTNVIVSAALSAKGNPAKIFRLFINHKISLYYNKTIYDEYSDVISRDYLKIPAEIQEEILDGIKDYGILLSPASSDMPLPDESDRIFYDTAKAAEALLITGNMKHYPDEPDILTPTQFLDMFEDK